ncbi:MAG: hypothetical protein ACRDRY_04000 [Pseudonocardiaceae bacterium]
MRERGHGRASRRLLEGVDTGACTFTGAASESPSDGQRRGIRAGTGSGLGQGEAEADVTGCQRA